jgi:hypothetical protein
MYNILRELKLWDKGYIKLIDSSEFNASEEGRLKAVQLAKICYGKCGTESKNPHKLWDKLAKEGTKSNPYSRSFELVPVVYDSEDLLSRQDDFYNLCDFGELTRFEYCKENIYYTNYRALVNGGVGTNNIPYNTADEVKDFKVVIAKLPMFIINHLKTHTTLTSIMNSARYMSSKDFNYWLPTDLKGRLKAYFENSDSYALQDIALIKLFDSYTDDTTVDLLLDEVSPNRFEEIFKALGYPKEIYQRQMAGFRYGEIVLAGWKNDPLVWDHMIELRSGTHTQKETREFIDGLVEVFR